MTCTSYCLPKRRNHAPENRPPTSHRNNASCFNISVFNVFQVPEINGFLTAGRKKNGEVLDELDRSLEGMDHSDEQFDKGNTFCPGSSLRKA